MAKNDINAQIQARVESFTEELSGLIRKAAVEAVREALGSGSGNGAATTTRRTRGPARKKAGAKRGRTRGGRRIRRSEEDIAALGEQIVGYVKANPSSRLEEISAGMGVPSADLKRPITNLLEAKALKKTGQKRGTRYSVGRKG